MFNKLLDTLAEKGAQLARYQGDLEGKVRELAQRDQEQESLIGELEAKNTELERFTYTVSHDLKSPLITIQGFLGFLESDARNGEWDRVRNDCQRIQSATSRMQQLLNDLLELSRIGRLVNQPEQVPFAVLAREAVERIAERLNPKHVQVEIEDSMPRVWVDRHRLSEVLDNLLDNAVKAVASQNSPRIEIGCRTGGGDPTFFVRDNGVGIEPAYHQKVFGLFEKLDESVEGTGVGLAIVKRIIEVHRGRIWVESDGPGQGSSFCFTLPMYTVDAMAEEVHCGG
jgi:signal transduction histidine kinase